MRVKTWQYVVTFKTTMSALAFEDACLKQGLQGRLIPVPSAVHSGCGLCFKMNLEEYEKHHDFVLRQDHDQIIKMEI
ncbi:DUF3343 domain-containing protein [[Clostridium] spiroforme]|nr:DUF3343 domain-containing protein [Thomasclavelia spiroformis]MBM6879511.1 DUF3343 domain-containing protein [Thomasclavelia spiroformis]